jgi:hypothetical protein
MNSKDKQQCIQVIEEEQNRMINGNVWRAVDMSKLDKNNKILTKSWAMKKKPYRKFQAHINAQVFSQIDGLHYDSPNTTAPVTNDITIRMILTLAMMAGWKGYLIDVKGANLNG